MENITPQPEQTVSTPVMSTPGQMPITATTAPPPSPMKKIIIALVALLVVGAAGAYVFLNSTAKPATLAEQNANPNTPPPSLELAQDNGLKGSFVETNQGTLQYEDADRSQFALNLPGFIIKYTAGTTVRAGTIRPGVNYLFADADITMADIVKGINPVANRLLIAYYTPGEGNLAAGFYTYPKGPFAGTIEISAGSLATFTVPKNRGVVVMAEKASTSYGLLDGSLFASNPIDNAFPDALNGWVMVGSKYPAIKDLIAPYKNRVISAWSMKSQTDFEKVTDLENFKFTTSNVVWLNLAKGATTKTDTNTETKTETTVTKIEPVFTASTLTVKPGTSVTFNATGTELTGAKLSVTPADTNVAITPSSSNSDTALEYTAAFATTAKAGDMYVFTLTLLDARTKELSILVMENPVTPPAKVEPVLTINPLTVKPGGNVNINATGTELTGAKLTVTPDDKEVAITPSSSNNDTALGYSAVFSLAVKGESKYTFTLTLADGRTKTQSVTVETVKAGAANNGITLKTKEYSQDYKPTPIIMAWPADGQVYTVEDLKDGIDFAAEDASNHASFLEDTTTKGVYYMSYSWDLFDSTGKSLMNVKYPVLPHEGSTADDCARTVKNNADDKAAAATAWVCPSGKLPKEITSTLPNGKYTLIGNVYDGSKYATDPTKPADAAKLHFIVNPVQPKALTFVDPAKDPATFVLSDLQKNGLKFKVNDTNSVANSLIVDIKDPTKHYLSYVWMLTSAKGVLWVNEPSDSTTILPYDAATKAADCTHDVTLLGKTKSIWTCAAGTIPTSVFAPLTGSVEAGEYTLKAMVLDGNTYSPEVSMKIKVIEGPVVNTVEPAFLYTGKTYDQMLTLQGKNLTNAIVTFDDSNITIDDKPTSDLAGKILIPVADYQTDATITLYLKIAAATVPGKKTATIKTDTGTVTKTFVVTTIGPKDPKNSNIDPKAMVLTDLGGLKVATDKLAFKSADLKANGLPFTATDSNTVSTLIDQTSGVYYLKYNFYVSQLISGQSQLTPVWSMEKNGLPSASTGMKDVDCTHTLGTDTAASWTCSSGIVPKAAFTNIKAGDYYFMGQVCDNNGSSCAKMISGIFTVDAPDAKSILNVATNLVNDSKNPPSMPPDTLKWDAPVSPVAGEKVYYIWKIVKKNITDVAAFDTASGVDVKWILDKGYTGTISAQDATCYAAKKWTCTNLVVTDQLKLNTMETAGDYTWGVKAYTDTLTSDWAIDHFTFKPSSNIYAGITPISVKKGAAGVDVSLKGIYLTGATVATPAAATGVTFTAPVITEGTITFTVSASATAPTAPSSAPVNIIITGKSSNQLATIPVTVVAPVAPFAVTSITPTTIYVGDKGVKMTIKGSGFIEGKTYVINSTSNVSVKSYAFVSDTEMSAIVDVNPNITYAPAAGYNDALRVVSGVVGVPLISTPTFVLKMK